MKTIFKLAGAGLLLAGGVLLFLANEAHNSAGEQVMTFFSGEPSDRVLQYGIGGVVCLILGIGGVKHGLGGKG